MKVIIAWSGDHTDGQANQASLSDDVEALRRISQNTDRGNKIWESWVTLSDGSLISYGGDAGRADVSAERLSELPRIREQYAQTVETSVSVGVGTKVSEADRALRCAQLRGGDRIVLYTPDIEPEIEAGEKKESGKSDPLSEESLGKSEPLEKAQLDLNTPEHRSWFDGSKVVDADGNPLRVHHGTSKDTDFSTFRIGKRGAWFTANPEEANRYALRNDSMDLKYGYDGKLHEVNTLSRVIPAYLSIKNPYRMTPGDLDAHKQAENYAKWQGDFFAGLRAKGHDGVDFGGGTWVAFQPHQIKSIFNGRPTQAGHISKAEPAMNPGPAAGFAGASQPSTPTVATPQVEASEHSQGEAAQTMVDDQPPGPEMTHAAQDLEDEFHDLAQQQEGDPEASASQKVNDPIRQQVVQVLQALKAQAPILEQVKQSAPDTYKAVMGLAQAVIAMAKEMNGDPAHMTQGEIEDRARSQAQVQIPLPPEEGEESSGDEKSKSKDDTKKSEPSEPKPSKAQLKEKRTKRIAELAASTKASAWPWIEKGRTRGSLVVHQNTRDDEPGWRLTLLDHKGTPKTHWATHTHEEALEYASRWTDIHGEPLKAVKKSETVSFEALVKAGESEQSFGEPLFKAASSLGWLPAFRHQTSGTIVSCHEGYHDLNELPGGNDQGWDSGFVDGKGTYYSREDARNHLKLNGTNSGSLHARQLHEGVKKSEGDPKPDWDDPKDEFDYNWYFKGFDTGAEQRAPRVQELASTTGGSAWKNKDGMYVVVSPDTHEGNQTWRASLLDPQKRPCTHLRAPDHASALHLAARMGVDIHGQPLKAAPIRPIKKAESEDWVDCDEHGHTWGVDAAGDHCLMCGGDRGVLEPSKELEKASLAPGKPPAQHHHLNLPVGSKVEPGAQGTRRVGRIKVLHPETGKQGWIQARAGQIMSKDGHAISSRNPGGK